MVATAAVSIVHASSYRVSPCLQRPINAETNSTILPFSSVNCSYHNMAADMLSFRIFPLTGGSKGCVRCVGSVLCPRNGPPYTAVIKQDQNGGSAGLKRSLVS